MKKEYYMAYEDRYNDAYKNNTLWETTKPTMEVINIIKEQKISTKDKILELGCGEGRDALYLLDKGYNILAIDYSKTVIEKCNELSNNKYKDNFKALDIMKDTLNDKYKFIYSVAVIHMFTEKTHRNKFYGFIYNHLEDDGISLIITMGDGINTYKSNTKDAFKKVKRTNINTGKQIEVAMTSCFIMDIDTLTKEIKDNNLDIIKTWISDDIPNFDKCICTLVKKKNIYKE